MLSPGRPLRIAFVIPKLVGHGAERSLLRLAHALVDHGHEVDLLLLNPVVDNPNGVPVAAKLFIMTDRANGSSPSEMSEGTLGGHSHRVIQLCSAVKVRNVAHMVRCLGWHPLTLPNLEMFKEAQFVANYSHCESPDCIVSMLPKPKVAALLAKTLGGSFPATISSVQNNVHFRRRREIQRYRRLLPHSDHVIAVSNGVRSSVLQATGVSPGRITVIYNPVVEPYLEKLAERSPDHTWLSDSGSPVILGVGRLVRQKDFPTLLRAFHRVAMNRSVRLIILGEGSHRTELERLVHNLGLDNLVSLPGYAANPYAFMARASVFALSSRYEGLGNVLIEALACGCPCVSTDCAYGPAEILDDGRVGPLVPVGDDVSLAGAIESMLDAPPDKKLLRRRAESFSVAASAARYESIISDVVRRRANHTGVTAADRVA